MKRKTINKIGVNIALSFFAIIICLLLLELVLRTGVFSGEDDPHPKWIPYKFQKIHKKINQENWEIAKLNPYRFTDTVRDFKKDTGVKRIAVLGDSFIWGYGIPYEQAWSHKLEKKITGIYSNVEVLNWGLGSWSTLDEASFFEKDGINYDIDMLIIGFVNNDPDMGDIEFKNFRWHKFFLVKPLKLFFPNAISFIRSHLYKFLYIYFKDFGYVNWVDKLYTEENLNKYSRFLQDFHSFCNAKNIELLFVLTPSNYDDVYKNQFDKIIPLLKNSHIKYLDLFPAVKRDLGHINQRKLWANPADGHPGMLLTDVFTTEVFNYLEREDIFSHKQDPYIQELGGGETNRQTLNTLVKIALKDDDWDLRKEAAVALGKINDPSIIDLLHDALNDENPDVRESAVDALGKIKDPRIVNILHKTLKDKNPHVRKRAILSLEETGDLGKTNIIIKLSELATEDNDRYVRKRAILALSKIKEPPAIEALIDSLKDEFFFNRKAAAIALSATKEPEAVEPLIALLEDNISNVRIEAVEALGELKDPRAVDALKNIALYDKDSLIRDTASDAIKKITGRDYARYRRKLLRLWEAL